MPPHTSLAGPEVTRHASNVRLCRDDVYIRKMLSIIRSVSSYVRAGTPASHALFEEDPELKVLVRILLCVCWYL